MGDTLKTYIKLYGPQILEALKALEDVAKKFEKKYPGIKYFYWVSSYAIGEEGLTPTPTTELRVEAIKLLSESGWSLGDYDFFFEWIKPPTFEQLKELIEEIDKALSKLRCKYTVTTK